VAFADVVSPPALVALSPLPLPAFVAVPPVPVPVSVGPAPVVCGVAPEPYAGSSSPAQPQASEAVRQHMLSSYSGLVRMPVRPPTGAPWFSPPASAPRSAHARLVRTEAGGTAAVRRPRPAATRG